MTTAAAAESDRALPRPRRAVVRRAVAERHVHEHDQPQPARVRHEHLGDRRGDQPVEQHDGVVGDPPDDVRRGRRATPRRVAASCRATACSCTDQPIAREPAADPAVVGVAAARPGRVVDAVGDDDVHRRHSGRS